MKALILAAGYGRRLYPITKEYPKPLLSVGGRAVIDYIVAKIEKIEAIDEILVVTNNKFFQQFMKWQKKLNCKKPIRLINDLTETNKTRLGALGDINFVIKNENIKDDLVVIGGDNFFDTDLDNFISQARQNKPCSMVGVYDTEDKVKAGRYGVACIDKNNRIVDFEEKPQKPKSSLVAMCLYYFPKRKLFLLNGYLNDKRTKHDATGYYINWLCKKDKVYAFVFKGSWYDIGHLDIYNEVRRFSVRSKYQERKA